MTEANQKTPLHALHVELGARMAPFAGYDMPIQYPAGVLAEHLHTRKAAGLFDVSHMGQALIESGDHAAVASFLESLCPADFLNLAPGRQRYTQLLNENGGIVDDLMVTRAPGAEGALRLVVNASRKEADFALIRQRLPSGVRLTPLPESALIALQGPLAAATLARLAPGQGLEAMAFMSARPARIAAFETFVSRSGYTGEDGYEISIASAQRGKLRSPPPQPTGRRAHRPRRARFAKARGGTLPLRARARRDGGPDRSRSRLVDSEAPTRRRRISRGQADSGRAREWPRSSARRRAAGRPCASARRSGDCLGRRGADWRRHVGRVRAERRRADCDGLRRARPCGGWNPGQPHRARQGLERACRHAAFSSPRLPSPLSQGDA